MPEDDIAADIRAAMDGPSEAAPVAEAPAPAAPEAAPPPAADRSRDEQGRFAPKTEETVAPKAQPVANPPDQAQASDANSVPASVDQEEARPFGPPIVWRPEQKAQFATLPTWAQEAIARREEVGEQGVAKLKQQLDGFQPIDSVLAPHRERWQMAGMSDVQALQSLLAAQSYLERDAQGAIEFLARQYGVSLGQVQLAQQGTPQGQPQPAPEFQALQRQLQDLQATIAQRDQAAEQARRQETQSVIDAFAKDPQNLYFNEVREEMAALMQAGRAPDLQAAYDMAVWARPDIRKLIQADEAQRSQAASQEQERQRAAAARQAGGSITGDTLGGHKPAAAPGSSNSIEDDIRRAFEIHAGVV
jgi:hypothetical protein